MSFRMLTPTVFEIGFESVLPLTFEAGQFISVVIPGAGPKGRDLRRAYSIASPPGRNPVELCVKLVEGGPGTSYLFRLRQGDTFRGFAPYGNFTCVTRSDRNACFVATGTGIAPFRSMILSKSPQAGKPLSTTLLMGVRDAAELLYDSELHALKELQYVPCITRPTPAWRGFRGRVTQYLRSADASFPWAQTDFYLCGSGEMIDEVKAILTERGVAKEAIHQELYYKVTQTQGKQK